jgi:hypothetical protein
MQVGIAFGQFAVVYKVCIFAMCNLLVIEEENPVMSVDNSCIWPEWTRTY